MLLELKIGLIAIIIFAIYMIILYFTNRNLCKKIVHKIMIEVELLSKSSIVKSKKDLFYSKFSQVIDLYLVRLPFARITLKWIVKYTLDKLIEDNVPKINETIKPLVTEVANKALATGIQIGVDKLTEKIVSTVEPTENEVVKVLADKIKTDENTKAVYSVYGKIMQGSEDKKPSWEAGANIVGKIGGA